MTDHRSFPGMELPSGPKTLAARPLGTADILDEELHAPVGTGHYSSSETSYYGFNIPQEAINGEIYLWFHPNLKVMSASIYIWRGLKTSTLSCEYVNHYTYLPWPEKGISEMYLEEVGLRVSVQDPLNRVLIQFDDPSRNVHFKLMYDAIMQPAVRPDGLHFTQAMQVRGDLTLLGEPLVVDGFFSRDHSWGAERRETTHAMPPVSWMVGIFNKSFAFHAMAYDDPACKPEWTERYPAIKTGENLVWGYLFKDGLTIPLKSAIKLTHREPDGLAPRLVELRIEDVSGRSLDLRGYVQARMPWQTWQNMNVYFCQTRWECAEGVGWGDTQDVQFNDFVHHFGRSPPGRP